MIDSRIALVLFATLFVVIVSFGANEYNVDGISCSDPANLISEPADNSTTVSQITGSAGGVIDVFFGCSSTNSLINGFFLSLKAAIVIVFLMIVKDLVPFT